MVVGVGPGGRAKQTKYSSFIAQITNLRKVHKSISLCPVRMNWGGGGVCACFSIWLVVHMLTMYFHNIHSYMY